mmetsp:Transcript_39934/g.93739  ORF Transcript_39934/g.93739 Transcript_39934/m.93739 type:complete len:146 (-) Transcript_39934:269-706(-)|eukprot:CAMPEP_0113297640 /NCGR_PEP_ID=MMETSP0010_2-20120614/418_1 /TAXON_ID=216773 ORGANISM="Corethron hystrix, Strain 308" /NCGR_SAMPLE_ID=MMETSP0010_2 /ASSEMBLY_ACC=CAM_ASM_000155 /LENGTH=145 /DNA_ID=CAMNT_0000150563 /DNA_START=174 /DNA_END=611 /DNA_ORIENTATION=+ /assembly_acc=CAM_ASM_000155
MKMFTLFTALVASISTCEGFGLHARRVEVPLQQQLSMSAPVHDDQRQILEREIHAVPGWKSSLVAASVISTFLPAVANAIADDADYEYGAVDAPIGIAVGGGILAILTALLPVFLKGGEEAFEEMKENDAAGWGTGNSDKLRKRK